MPPAWLADVARCPEDRGALDRDLVCERCGRRAESRDGVVDLLPERLAHIVAPGAAGASAEEHPHLVAPGTGGGSSDEHVRWVEAEMAWWDPRYDRPPGRPFSPVAGLRGRSRERNLLRHVRARLPERPVVIEMGAGDSLTVAGLMPPDRTGIRYIATDVSPAALRTGRPLLGGDAASVLCDAVDWPFREGAADLVLVLGVLHHLSDWRAALDRACRTVRPGGFLLLHEAVTKPRVLGRFRAHGVDDHWVSPHEGDVPRQELLAFLGERGVVERHRGEESPLRFALVRYVVQRFELYDRLERSAAMAAALNAADQAFGRTLGRITPSLGFGELTVVWRR